jgi:hypothetical protein
MRAMGPAPILFHLPIGASVDPTEARNVAL